MTLIMPPDLYAHRGCDAVAPIIHEWTYEAMAYDLLGLTSSTFRYESETAGGKVESKEHILDERDELWVSPGLLTAHVLPNFAWHERIAIGVIASGLGFLVSRPLIDGMSRAPL